MARLRHYWYHLRYDPRGFFFGEIAVWWNCKGIPYPQFQLPGNPEAFLAGLRQLLRDAKEKHG